MQHLRFMLLISVNITFVIPKRHKFDDNIPYIADKPLRSRYRTFFIHRDRSASQLEQIARADIINGVSGSFRTLRHPNPVVSIVSIMTVACGFQKIIIRVFCFCKDRLSYASLKLAAIPRPDPVLICKNASPISDFVRYE